MMLKKKFVAGLFIVTLFFIEDTLVSQTILTEAFPPLSITLWNDNQFATILPGGELVIEDHSVTETQNFDIAYVEVLKE